jgi:hypothetical protein
MDEGLIEMMFWMKQKNCSTIYYFLKKSIKLHVGKRSELKRSLD